MIGTPRLKRSGRETPAYEAGGLCYVFAMGSKRFKRKDCAYCGGQGISTTADHVLAREFFLIADRANLPQVPSCQTCNNVKSALEHYATATLVAGSNHVEGDKYRRDMVAPRIANNRKIRNELGINEPPVWIKMGGILQKMHILKVDATKLHQLISLITKGLYFLHFGRALDDRFFADVSMFDPVHEVALWASIQSFFPQSAIGVTGDLGRGSFRYEGVKSPANEAFTAWRMEWHGGIRLYGADSPPGGISTFWVITRPTADAVNQEIHTRSTHK